MPNIILINNKVLQRSVLCIRVDFQFFKAFCIPIFLLNNNGLLCSTYPYEPLEVGVSHLDLWLPELCSSNWPATRQLLKLAADAPIRPKMRRRQDIEIRIRTNKLSYFCLNKKLMFILLLIVCRVDGSILFKRFSWIETFLLFFFLHD